MIEKISLRTFWTCMILCAINVLTLIWFPLANGTEQVPLRIQITATFFVVGLASLLLWVPLITYQFYSRLEDK